MQNKGTYSSESKQVEVKNIFHEVKFEVGINILEMRVLCGLIIRKFYKRNRMKTEKYR